MNTEKENNASKVIANKAKELEIKRRKEDLETSKVDSIQYGVNVSGIIWVTANDPEIAKERAKLYLTEKFKGISVGFAGIFVAEKDNMFDVTKQWRIGFSIYYTGG